MYYNVTLSLDKSNSQRTNKRTEYRSDDAYLYLFSKVNPGLRLQ